VSMCETITAGLLRQMILDCADTLQVNADYLTQLDVPIGDGDHGRSMALGFQSVCNRLEVTSPSTPGALLRLVGMTLIATVGGASGPLYGAAFTAAGIAANTNAALDIADLAVCARSAADAVGRRGRCRLGDKTILDALEPAARALADAAAARRPLLHGLQAAVEAARQGMEATIPLVARRGLAMQYGAASAGHQDPGATSCYLMLDSILRTFRQSCPHDLQPTDYQEAVERKVRM
jgi:phosphoenolpyruvate---glycerone phosphotransferase subunit DhaL